MLLTDIIFFSIEIACFLTTLYCLRGDPSPAWRLHRWYMGIVVLVESGGLIIANGFHQSTHWWYNIYLPIQCAFISWFVFRCIRRFKPISWWWLYSWYAVFAIAYVIDSLSIKAYVYNNSTSQLMKVVVIISCLYYYFLLQRSTRYYNLNTFADFWWINGLMYFYFSTIVLFLFIPQLGDAYVWGTSLFQLLNALLIVVFYGTWIYAYLMRYRERSNLPAISGR